MDVSDGECEKSQLLEPVEDKEEACRKEQERDRVLERLLDSAGYGFFHVLVILVSALALSADAVEILGVGFVVPIAEQDLNLNTARKGYLDASVFVGMFVGGFLWGSLADVFGRRVTLFTAVLLNGVCGLLAAFSPNFLFFIFLRLASGVGIGGSIPIIFSYVSEFFTEKQKGPVIIFLNGTWSFGIVYAAVLAWGILGLMHPIDSYIGSLHFVNWRLFLVLCTIPAFLFVSVSLFLPNSPAYLFHSGQEKALHMTLRRIRRVNSLCSCCYYQPQTGISLMRSDSETMLEVELLSPNSMYPSPTGDKVSPTGEHPPPTPPADGEAPPTAESRHSSGDRCCCANSEICDKICAKIQQVACAGFKLFGKKYLLATVLLATVHFAEFFANYGLVLWLPEYFKRLHLLDAECNRSDFTLTCSNDTNLRLYQDTLYAALPVVPGALAALILINFLGGRILAVSATLASSLSVFLIWGLPNSRTAVVAASGLFAATLSAAFGGTAVVVVTFYDVKVRSTSQGFITGVGRIGAILANLMFGHLLDVSRAIPILIVALVLSYAAGALVFLPPVYRPENRPPLERVISYFMLWLKSKLCHR